MPPARPARLERPIPAESDELFHTRPAETSRTEVPDNMQPPPRTSYSLPLPPPLPHPLSLPLPFSHLSSPGSSPTHSSNQRQMKCDFADMTLMILLSSLIIGCFIVANTVCAANCASPQLLLFFFSSFRLLVPANKYGGTPTPRLGPTATHGRRASATSHGRRASTSSHGRRASAPPHGRRAAHASLCLHHPPSSLHRRTSSPRRE